MEGFHGVDIAVIGLILEKMGRNGTAVECTGDQLINVRIKIKGKCIGASFVITYIFKEITTEGKQRTIIASPKKKEAKKNRMK